MRTLRKLLLTPLTGIAVLTATISASAANHYVRSAAAGAANGSNWTDAWTNLPATLVRGDTYYIADGTYAGAITLNTPDSGSTWIYIRKATPSDHGTLTGWQDSYGTSNALFTGPWTLSSDYWDMDGRTGSDRAGYGFEVFYNTTTADSIFEITGSNINFQHMNVHAYPEGTSPKDSMGDPTGGSLGYYQGMKLDHASNLYFGHCYIHHLYGCPFQPVNANNVTMENCYIANNRNTAAWHSAGLAINGACSNYVVRYNKFCDIDGSAVFDGINGVAGDLLLNWDIYGNVIWHTGSYGSTLAGVISIWNDVNNHQTAQNLHVYNNTIFNISGWFSIQFLSTTTSAVQIFNNLIVQNRTNNLYVNYGMISFAGGSGNSYDYNYYGLCAFPYAMSSAAHENTIYDGPNCRLSDAPGFSGFLDPANGDFHLRGPITNYAGLTLLSPYNIDPDGKVRGLDGNWDRGAYEFVAPPVVLNIARVGTNALLSWPTNNSGYTLESTLSLNLPAWTNVAGTPVIVGNQFIVTNGAVATNIFYRLRSP